MTDQDKMPMKVRVLINGEKQLTLQLEQDDPNNPNWRGTFQSLGDSELHVMVYGDGDGTDTKVHFNLCVKEEVESVEETDAILHEVEGTVAVSGPWDWKSLTWKRKLPVRPSFPGEPPLPRTTIEVTLELEEALVLAA